MREQVYGLINTDNMLIILITLIIDSLLAQNWLLIDSWNGIINRLKRDTAADNGHYRPLSSFLACPGPGFWPNSHTVAGLY